MKIVTNHITGRMVGLVNPYEVFCADTRVAEYMCWAGNHYSVFEAGDGFFFFDVFGDIAGFENAIAAAMASVDARKRDID